jgi:hypothetical protein
LGADSVWSRHEGANITEPSAAAPDAKVKLSIKGIAQLMANVDFRIRRYRARFCKRPTAHYLLLSFTKLNEYRILLQIGELTSSGIQNRVTRGVVDYRAYIAFKKRAQNAVRLE